MNELIPTGKLRVGLAVAPALSALFVVKDKDGTPRGVPVDLANELATQLGVPVEFMLAPNTGELTDALEAGTIDVSFMPVDDERRKRIDFGPIYFLVESTYLATEVSGIKSAEEVDRPGIRVIGIANTTTIRAAARSLKHTTMKAMQSVGEAVAMMASGKADAFALSRDSLPPFAKMLPGSRIVDRWLPAHRHRHRACRKAGRRRSLRSRSSWKRPSISAWCAARSTVRAFRTSRSRRRAAGCAAVIPGRSRSERNRNPGMRIRSKLLWIPGRGASRRPGMTTESSVIIPRHAAALRHALEFHGRPEHHAIGELVHHRALNLLPGRLARWIGIAAALLQRRAALGQLAFRNEDVGGALVEIDAHAVAGL